MEQANTIGEVKPEKKVAFTNRKYTNEERQKKDEEELAQLVEENKAKPEEAEVEDVVEEAPAEEASDDNAEAETDTESDSESEEDK